MKKTGNTFYWALKRAIVCNLIFVAWSSLAEVTVQSVVDRNQVAMGETLTLTVSVRNDEGSQIGEPRVPNLDGFDLLNSWTSTSTSSRLIQTPSGMDFKTTRREDYNYMLAPQRRGTLPIGSFEVVVGSKVYQTKQIKIDVIGSGGSTLSQKGEDEDAPNKPEERFSQLLKERARLGQGYRSMPKNTKEAFFIQIELDKKEVYVGEQIVARWYLYARGQIEHIDRLKFPTLRGFWKEEIEAAPTLNFRQEVVNGVVYRKALLASHALFPIRAGTAVVDEYKVKAVVRLPSGNFGFFAFGKPYTYTKSSERVKVKVNPLPTKNRPPEFTGAVGKFDVSAIVEGERFPVGQPFSFKIRFEGRGNAKMIDLPPLDFPSQIELYDTKVSSKYFKNGTSYKDFEILLIPREEGRFMLPGVETAIFNPDTGEFEKKKTQSVPLNIEPGANQQAIAAQRFTNENEAKAQTVDPVLPPPATSLSQGGRLSHSVIWGSWLGFSVLLMGLLIFKARNELGFGRARYDLLKIVDERMNSVSRKVERKDWRAAGTEMANVIYAVIGEIAGTGGASLEMSRLIERIPPSVRRELGQSLIEDVERVQTIGFAPEAVVGELKDKQNLKKLAQRIETQLRTAIRLYEKNEAS